MVGGGYISVAAYVQCSVCATKNRYTAQLKVTVWSAVAEFGVWGPCFFEEDGQIVTVTSDRYCHMIETFLRPKINHFVLNHEEEEVWFQQDRARAHTARRSMEMLRELFPGRIVSLRGDISWSSHYAWLA